MRALCLLLLAACASTTEPGTTIAPVKVSLRSATALLRPVIDPQDLIGRAVELRPDGKWTIADERAPGCMVEIKRSAAEVHEHNRSYVRGVAALEADYLNVAQLSGDSSEIRQVDFDVQQSEILQARIVGPCGADVVTTVYVGRGKQGFLGSRHRSVGAEVGVEGFGLQAGAEEQLETVDEIAWQTPMAYAFEHRQFSSAQALHLSTNLPSHLDEGWRLELAIKASRPAYLIVFGVDASGAHSLLWPSNEEQAPLATADVPAEFPSQSERAAGYSYRLKLPAGTVTPVGESLLVYGFSERGDFEAMHPNRLGGDARYAEKLKENVASIPPARWARYEFHYDVRPTDARPPLVTAEGSP
ncbi:MAG TPA: DUF4384 domain-containing protein [Polyangiales bacterium]|nr:DUF4384 domain-containing protein [Polyangiales bacterium]